MATSPDLPGFQLGLRSTRELDWGLRAALVEVLQTDGQVLVDLAETERPVPPGFFPLQLRFEAMLDMPARAPVARVGLRARLRRRAGPIARWFRSLKRWR